MAKMKSGWTDYGPARVRGERAALKGIMKDARSFGIRSPGGSKGGRKATTQKTTKGRGNLGSFGRQGVSKANKGINTGGNYGPLGF